MNEPKALETSTQIRSHRQPTRSLWRIGLAVEAVEVVVTVSARLVPFVSVVSRNARRYYLFTLRSRHVLKHYSSRYASQV